MTTMRAQPRYAATAKILDAAVRSLKLRNEAVASAAGVSGGTLSNWRHARSGPDPANARKLAKLLGVEDPATLVAPSRAEWEQRRAAGPGEAGPARRAVLLLERQQTPPAVQTPFRASQSHGGVFGMEVGSDGMMGVWVKARLPYERGAVLLRLLLDFGLIGGEPPGDGGTEA